MIIGKSFKNSKGPLSATFKESNYDLFKPFYDPLRSYDENFKEGPFGDFADGKIYHLAKKTKYQVFGYKVNSLFGIPPGPLINGNFVKAALDKGFDIVTYKTVRTKKHPCAPFPNVLAVHPKGDLTFEMASIGLTGDNNYIHPLAITNSFGVPSQDPDYWQHDLAQVVRYAGEGQLVIGGFQGTIGRGEDDYIEDFALAARLVKETGVNVLEVNLSCPNEGTNNLLCFDIPRTEKVINSIKNEIGNTPLIIKIAYFNNKDMFEKLLERVGNIIDGISAINTIPSKIYKVKNRTKQALPGNNRLISGVCGQPIKWAGIEMVQRLNLLRNEKGYNYTIFGVGGVMFPADYQEYISAGADVVMSATGAMWNPYLALEIKESLMANK